MRRGGHFRKIGSETEVFAGKSVLLLRRFKPQQHAIRILVPARPALGQHVQEFIRSLPHVTKAHAQFRQHRVDLPDEHAVE